MKLQFVASGLVMVLIGACGGEISSDLSLGTDELNENVKNVIISLSPTTLTERGQVNFSASARLHKGTSNPIDWTSISIGFAIFQTFPNGTEQLIWVPTYYSPGDTFGVCWNNPHASSCRIEAFGEYHNLAAGTYRLDYWLAFDSDWPEKLGQRTFTVTIPEDGWELYDITVRTGLDCTGASITPSNGTYWLPRDQGSVCANFVNVQGRPEFTIRTKTPIGTIKNDASYQLDQGYSWVFVYQNISNLNNWLTYTSSVYANDQKQGQVKLRACGTGCYTNDGKAFADPETTQITGCASLNQIKKDLEGNFDYKCMGDQGEYAGWSRL